MMKRWFKNFLVGLLGFCVLMGAFCILWPLTHPEEILIPDPQPTQPVETDAPPSEAEPGPEQVVKPEPEPIAEPEPSEPTPEDRRAQAVLRTMSLEEKVYQLFVVTPEALTGVGTATLAGDTTRAALTEKPVGGIVYFAKNLVNAEQAQAMLETTQSYSKRPLLLCVDEEGGTVSRVGSNPDMGATSFGNMADYGAQGDETAVREVGETIGSELRELGFNVDFAPVADVLTDPDNTAIGRRAFSSDPEVVSKMVRAEVEGLTSSGCLPVLKHFPGHGDTDADTHDGPAVTHRTAGEMEKCELLPFQAGIEAGAPMVMVGHFSAPALTGTEDPCCLSADVVTELLRKKLRFRGVVITDALEMRAISDQYSSAEAAVAAVQAGVDLLLMPEDLEKAVQGLLDAIEQGELSEARIDESVVRILSMKYKYELR